VLISTSEFLAEKFIFSSFLSFNIKLSFPNYDFFTDMDIGFNILHQLFDLVHMMFIYALSI